MEEIACILALAGTFTAVTRKDLLSDDERMEP